VENIFYLHIVDTSMKQMAKDITLDEVLFFQVEKMMKQSKMATMAMFRKHGIELTKDQWVILKAISDREGQTQVELSNWTDRDPASMKRTLDILLTKKLISKRSSATDSKALCIYLSAKGKKIVAEVTPLAKAIRKKGFKGISKNELKKTMEVIIRIKENFQ